jgi:hypothetical protein
MAMNTKGGKPNLREQVERYQKEFSAEWRKRYDRRPLFESGADRLLTHAERKWLSPLGGQAVEEKSKRR